VAFISPRQAGALLAEFIETRYGVSQVEIILQEDYLAQGREHCDTAPITLISDEGHMVMISLHDDFIEYAETLGYWAEPWDDVELCIMPLEREAEKYYQNIAKNYSREVNLACQESYNEALKLISTLPIVHWDEGGMHQFTHLRMKDFIRNDYGRITREAIIDNQPRNLRDLEPVLSIIRRLPCVANVWYKLD